MEDLWLWEVEYNSLKACIHKLDRCIAILWIPATSHSIIFEFEREVPGKGILKIKSIQDSEGRIKICKFSEYIPYPNSIIKLVRDMYGSEYIKHADPYVVYDPNTTLQSYRVNNSDPTVIKKKLLADASFIQNVPSIQKITGGNASDWIEFNV